MPKVFVAAAVLAIATPVFSQTPGSLKPAVKSTPAKAGYKTPKTAWGEPDLQGVYTNNDESGIPLERPSQFDGKKIEDVSDSELAELTKERNRQAEERAPNLGVLPGSNPVHWFESFNAKNSRPWLVVDPPDGRVPPLVAEAQGRRGPGGGSSFGNGPFNSTLDFSLYDRCISRGVPGSMTPAIYGNAYQIVQGPGWVGIRYEMIHEARVIPMDNRPHPSSKIRELMGDAKGHWDGDTLVVETTNFDRRMLYRNASETLTIIERFTRVAPDTVVWSVTLDDPHTWTRPWTYAMNLSMRDASQQPFEYACHEGNYGLRNMLNAARQAEKAAAADAVAK
jgi:hypothetical protein